MTPLDTQLIGAVIALFTLIVGGGRWIFNRMAAELTVCQTKLDALQKAAQEELNARRMKEQEEIAAWRATQQSVGKGSE